MKNPPTVPHHRSITALAHPQWRRGTQDCLFGDEPAEESGEEPESSSDDGVTDEAAYRGSLETVFSLGWHTLLDLKKASFWKDNMDTASEKKKRRYNNTNREALAKYARQQSVGAFSRNGVDPHRLQKLVGLPSCQCPLNGVTYTFICFFNRTTCCRKELPVEVCGSPIGPYSGANNICFKQFANSKELPSFLKSFWGLAKTRSRFFGAFFWRNMKVFDVV